MIFYGTDSSLEESEEESEEFDDDELSVD